MGQVDYTIEIVDELPEQVRGGGGGGKRIYDELIEQVQEHEGKWVRIGLFLKGTAATAAKNQLQKRYGRTAAVTGFKFETRRLKGETDTDPDKVGLFAKYTSDSIVNGALEAHRAQLVVREKELAAAREKAAAEGASMDDDEAPAPDSDWEYPADEPVSA